ncbi:MAG TPA: hypothetical protein VE177_00495 [Candidatus Binatus sp.]|jgi:hypothetical protein|nr:hypothetical protein [Candidatus Binatus sp.]
MEPVKAPVPVEVKDLQNFARLALSLTDGSPILWRLEHEGRSLISLFTAYMYWHGDIPILAYTEADGGKKPFLAYRSNGPKGEEWVFTDDADDTRFKYASTIRVKNVPEAFKKSLEGIFPHPPEPVLTEVEDLNSLARVLLTLSIREGTVFPLWHFERDSQHILGTVVPFEHYYDQDALPVLFHARSQSAPTGAFLQYSVHKPVGERVDFVATPHEAKSFYAKIIDVKDLPLFPA